MWKTRFILATSALGILVAVAVGWWTVMRAAVGSYTPPAELDRADGLDFRDTLAAKPKLYLSYTWRDLSKKVIFTARDRASPTSPWSAAVRKEEGVSFHMTATAPLYSPGGIYTAGLFIVGVQGTAENPETVIERWSISVARSVPFPGGGGGKLTISVNRNHVLTDPSLTHLWAAAAGQDGTFLLALHMETRQIWRIDLQSGARTVIADPTTYPALQHYRSIAWLRHATNGDAFSFSQLRAENPSVLFYPNRFILWDSDADGVPNSIEELTPDQYQQAGYLDISVWYPINEFDANWP